MGDTGNHGLFSRLLKCIECVAIQIAERVNNPLPHITPVRSKQGLTLQDPINHSAGDDRSRPTRRRRRRYAARYDPCPRRFARLVLNIVSFENFRYLLYLVSSIELASICFFNVKRRSTRPLGTAHVLSPALTPLPYGYVSSTCHQKMVTKLR